MAKPNRRECRFDGIGRSQVPPELGREVIEGQQLLAILPQAFARFLILGVVFLQEVIECCLGVRFRLVRDSAVPPDDARMSIGAETHGRKVVSLICLAVSSYTISAWAPITVT